jgi:hypothetical protein
MSEDTKTTAAPDSVPAAVGMRVNGMRTKSSRWWLLETDTTLHRQAVACTKGGISTQGGPELIREAHRGEEGPSGYEGKGEGNEG